MRNTGWLQGTVAEMIQIILMKQSKHENISNVLHSAHGVEKYFRVVNSGGETVCIMQLNFFDQGLFIHLSIVPALFWSVSLLF